jgi:hypothetical protein
LLQVTELEAGNDRGWFDDHPGRSFRARIAAEYGARLASRRRRCYVYENIDGSYHLLVVDDDGTAGILVEQVGDWEAGCWIASLVTRALASKRRKAKRRARRP